MLTIIDWPIIWQPDPEIIRLFGIIPLYYYSLLFAFGLWLAYGVVARKLIKAGFSSSEINRLAIYIFVGILLGARLGHCLFYEPDYFLDHPWKIFLPFEMIGGHIEWTGYRGLASHGGAIGVLVAIIIFCFQSKRPLLSVFDRVVIGTPLAAAFIRLGNFMNSEIIGIPTQGQMGVVFRHVDELIRHPAQLYEAGFYFILFAIMLRIDRRDETVLGNGLATGVFLVLLFSFRFGVEFIKTNQVDFENHMILNMGQLLSIPFVIFGLALMMRSWKRRA